jgi:hypothetical protein
MRAALSTGRNAPNFFGEVHQDGSRLENPDRRRTAQVHQRRDFGVRVHFDEYHSVDSAEGVFL